MIVAQEMISTVTATSIPAVIKVNDYSNDV